MSGRIFVCVLNSFSPAGDEALLRSVSAKVSGLVARGNFKAGINDHRRVVSKSPVVVAWEFRLSGVSGFAFRKEKKNSFKWFQEEFEDKLDFFDKAEQVRRGVDYDIVWEDKTL